MASARARRTVSVLLFVAALMAAVLVTSAQAGTRSNHWSAKFLGFTNNYRTAQVG